MISLISIFVFAGFYLWYATSKRITVRNTLGFEAWSQQNRLASKLFGSLFLIAACGLTIGYLGIGAGIFTFLIALMTIASLVILLVPLGVLSYFNLFLVFVLSAIFEIFL